MAKGSAFSGGSANYANVWPMKRLAIPFLSLFAAIGCLGLSGPASAGTDQPILVAASEKPAQTCLTDSELRDEVSAKRAIPQPAALRAARAVVPAEPVRARLCRRDGTLVYVITALAKDGKVTRIVLEAETGRVIGQR